VKLVLVCGGGGAKALACAGAWRAIAEAGHELVVLEQLEEAREPIGRGWSIR